LAAPTVIHGEFYPANILMQGESVCPVDWESAAVAAGEIDLATVTEDWPDEYVEECNRVYCQARWPDGAPAAFERTLLAAQLYLWFRWLGDEQEVTTCAGVEWCLERIRTVAERLGLI
jgi:thiamine kinase-like enzyme